jgi:hypothetical protein
MSFLTQRDLGYLQYLTTGSGQILIGERRQRLTGDLRWQRLIGLQQSLAAARLNGSGDSERLTGDGERPLHEAQPLSSNVILYLYIDYI